MKSGLETEFHLAYVLIPRGLEGKFWRKYQLFLKIHDEATEMKPTMAEIQVIYWMPNATPWKLEENRLRTY